MLGLTFKAVDASTWKDFETLFESRGGPKFCWCMVWRASGNESHLADGKHRKAFMYQRIHSGVPVGILGYHQDTPIAWCSIAPKKTYRNLTGQLST